MSLYAASVPQMIKMLRNLWAWMDQAAELAEARGTELSVFLDARLYPDMFTLRRQIQSACDQAKFAGARLAGVEAPSHPDTEQDLDELRARTEDVVAFLEGLDRDAIDGAGERVVELPFLPGQGVSGVDYLHEMAIPNFYFHVTTAYAILRSLGVPLGKRRFIGSMRLFDLDG